MKNIDGLPKDEQIKKLKKDNKIRLIIMCVYTPIIIVLSIYLILLKERFPVEIGVGLLVSLPASIHMGYILQVKHNNKKIKELECKDKNYPQLKYTALIEEKKEKYSFRAWLFCLCAYAMCGSFAIEILTDGIKIEIAIISGIIFIVIPFIVGIILYIISKTLK